MFDKINRIDTIRGGKLGFFDILPNGDRLDSITQYYSDNILQFTNRHVNTDPSTSWAGKGGIVAESALQFKHYGKLLYWICGPRPSGVIVLHIFKATPERFKQINSVNDLTDDDRVVLSLIPNPAHDNHYEMDWILYHPIGVNGDGSHGCFSEDGFQATIKNFSVGDKGIFNLTREPTWTAPEGYLLPGRIPE